MGFLLSPGPFAPGGFCAVGLGHTDECVKPEIIAAPRPSSERGNGELERDTRAACRAIAGIGAAAMSDRDSPDERRAQPERAVVFGATVAPVETVEDAR